MKKFTDPSDGMTVDDVANVSDWINKTDEKKPQLDQHTQQDYIEITSKMIRENNADLVSPMVSNNEIKDSLILEKTTAQKEKERKQVEGQIKPDLCVYLRNENDENTTFKGQSKRIAKLKINKKKPY